MKMDLRIAVSDSLCAKQIIMLRCAILEQVNSFLWNTNFQSISLLVVFLIFAIIAESEA